jgi:ribonuclease VapC
MVLDSSAVLAILLVEPDAAIFAQAIEEASTRLISAGTVLELGIVAEARRDRQGRVELDNFVLRTRLDIVPFDGEQAEIAREAYRRFGRGNHAANLNFGDCFAYALAKVSGETLLCKGDDFARTDIAIWRAADERP